MHLSILDANRFAEGVPLVQQAGDDDALTLLRFDFSHQQSRAKTALDARDLRLDERALPIAILVLECINSLLLDVADVCMVCQFSFHLLYAT
jgi:hypothetical protein